MGTLPDALKFVLRDSGQVRDNKAIFAASSLPYLTGLRDAKVEGAQELIDLIEKYEAVELWLQY